MIVLNKYKWDTYGYLINKKYILFIPKVFLNINWEIIKVFNLSDPLEKQLAKINGFYEVLMKLDVWVDKETVIKLEDEIKRDPSNAINWEADAWQDMWEFAIMYDYEWWCEWVDYCKDGCIVATYSEYQYWEHIQWLEKWDEDNRYECYTKEEFNLLMQIYYGVYDDEKLKKELEEKEKKWEFDKVKDIVKNNTKWWIYDSVGKLTKEEKQLLEEYLKLELMRKPTDWAFPELNIRKIYDKNWDEEEQKKVIEEINKEIGKEVVVLG